MTADDLDEIAILEAWILALIRELDMIIEEEKMKPIDYVQ